MERTGSAESWDTAFGLALAGGNTGAVGWPYEVSDIPVYRMWDRGIGVKGGGAPQMLITSPN